MSGLYFRITLIKRLHLYSNVTMTASSKFIWIFFVHIKRHLVANRDIENY